MYESDLCSHEKARKLRALLLSGGEAVTYNFGCVLGAVKPFHPITCECNDTCEVFVVLPDCSHKQNHLVRSTQSSELSKCFDLADVFFD